MKCVEEQDTIERDECRGSLRQNVAGFKCQRTNVNIRARSTTFHFKNVCVGMCAHVSTYVCTSVGVHTTISPYAED